MMETKPNAEQFAVPRGTYLLTMSGYIFGIVIGSLFIGLWIAGLAEMVLGLVGVGMVLVCLYLLPETLGPALKGDSFVVGPDEFQYVRAGNKVLGNVPFANVDAVTINERDGGHSLWVRLIDPAAEGTFWIGGLDSMNVIFQQCGYHLVVGQGLKVAMKSLEASFLARIRKSP